MYEIDFVIIIDRFVVYKDDLGEMVIDLVYQIDFIDMVLIQYVKLQEQFVKGSLDFDVIMVDDFKFVGIIDFYIILCIYFKYDCICLKLFFNYFFLLNN